MYIKRLVFPHLLIIHYQASLLLSMQIFKSQSFLLVAFVVLTLVALAQGLVVKNENVTKVASDADEFKAHLLSKCHNGKGIITEGKSGEIYLECDTTGAPKASQHKFETSLYVKTNEGTFSISVGGNGFSVGGKVEKYRYGGCVSSAWGTYRCMMYGEKSSIQSVINEPKRCDPNGDFCFDIYSDVCQFFFANKSWERICPNLRVISFKVNP